MNKTLGALYDPPASWHSESSPISQSMAGLAVLISWLILKGSYDFIHTFSMALYHKQDVKNDFAFVLQFFSVISDSLGGVFVKIAILQMGFLNNKCRSKCCRVTIDIRLEMSFLQVKDKYRDKKTCCYKIGSLGSFSATHEGRYMQTKKLILRMPCCSVSMPCVCIC